VGYIVRVNAAGTEALDATYFGSSTAPANGQEERIADLKLDSTGNVYVTGITNSPSTFPHGASFGKGLTDQLGNVDAGFVAKLDPTLSTLKFSTILGGAQPGGLALDSANEPYVTGGTRSAGFPTTAGAFQSTFNSSSCLIAGNSFPCFHAFITKLNANGSALVFSSFLEGSASDVGRSIGVDSRGNAYVTGVTVSANFPVTKSAFQKTYPGGTCFGTDPCNSGFVTMMISNGKSLFYSSYLGGHGDDEPVKIFIDPAWNAFVAGGTSSTNFPTTAGAFQRTLSGMSDAFISKVIIEADLALSSTGPTTVKHGTNMTYTIHGNNNGPDPAFQVKITDTIPTGTTFVSATTNVGTCIKPPVGGTGVITCSVGTLNPLIRMDVTVTLHVNAPAGSVLTDRDTLASITQDLTPENNSGLTVTTQVF
ncbi:MAG TPA: SBBP repeat-containing protein, partial [Candidatus Angelobacter sp.]|nr:SBBP repeat-containing protein [Candidatus Angelobacter sp.]